jgi:hypothetical protein
LRRDRLREPPLVARLGVENVLHRHEASATPRLR